MKIQFGHIKKLQSFSILLDGSQEVFNGVEVRYKNEEIEIVNQYRNIREFDSLVATIAKGSPVLLHFEGKGVLNKKFEKSTNYRQDITVNGNASDFYFTDYTEEQTVYTSVVRKTVVKNVLDRFKAAGLLVIGVSSGPFTLMAIHEYLNEKELISSIYKLSISGNLLSSFSKKETTESKSYRIGNERIENTAITSLASAALFFQPSSKIELPEKEVEIKNNIEESGQKVLFKQFGFSLMGFFLIALFCNFLYLNYLNKKHQTNVFLLAEHTETFNQINKLEEEKTRKETLLRTSGVLTKKFISFYITTVSNSAPKEVSFTEFIVKPTKEEVKDKYKIEVDNQQLIVKGTSKSSQYLSDWLSELKTIEWIRKVEIEEYEYKKGYGEFYLKIVI